MIKLIVDGKELEVEEGTNVLAACLDNGIYIPHLCFMKEMENPPASCRLCFVEIEGESKPVTSCRIEAKEGMVVRTDTEAVRQLQRWGLRLLLSVHRVECRICPSNKKCDLQRMAKLLHVRLKPRRLESIERQIKGDEENTLFDYNPYRCVLCGKCIFVCLKRNGYSLLTFAKRGFDTVISSFADEDCTDLPCRTCQACVDICPVSALSLKGDRCRDEGTSHPDEIRENLS